MRCASGSPAEVSARRTNHRRDPGCDARPQDGQRDRWCARTSDLRLIDLGVETARCTILASCANPARTDDGRTHDDNPCRSSGRTANATTRPYPHQTPSALQVSARDLQRRARASVGDVETDAVECVLRRGAGDGNEPLALRSGSTVAGCDLFGRSLSSRSGPPRWPGGTPKPWAGAPST